MTRRTIDDDRTLDQLFAPRAIVVIGASAEPGSIGARPARYLHEAGYAGRVFQVGRHPAPGFVTSLDEIPEAEQIDLAMVLVRADRVVEALRGCARRGIGAAIVGSSGFAELGDEGAALERQIGDVARETGIRVIGPNSLGLVNAASSTFATFASMDDQTLHDSSDSSVAIISQSGALASYLVHELREAGIASGTWIATGNEADVTATEVVSAFGRWPDLRLILVYLEGVHSGDRLQAAIASAVGAGVVVGVIKAGRSAAGAAAIASHTASVAGEDRLFDAAVRQAGGIRLSDVSEAVALASLVQRGRLPDRLHLELLTLSGGMGALMADEAEAAGLDLVPMPEPVQAALKDLVPFASVANPVDATAQILNDHSVLGGFLSQLLSVADADVLLFFAGPALLDARIAHVVVEGLERAVRDRPGLQTMLLLSGTRIPQLEQRLVAAGVTFVTDPLPILRVLGKVQRARERRRSGFAGSADTMLGARPTLVTVLDEHTSKQLVAAAGVRAPNSLLVVDLAAADAFRAQNGTIVLKGVAAGVAHKSELGLVKVGLSDDSMVLAAWNELTAALEPYPGSTILAEEFVSGSAEVLLDVRRDAVYGCVVTAGSGGRFTETDDDVVVWLGMPARDEFERDLKTLRLWPRIAGHRGTALGDLDAFYAAVAAVHDMVATSGSTIAEVEINPLGVLEAGRGVVALDAVVWDGESR